MPTLVRTGEAAFSVQTIQGQPPIHDADWVVWKVTRQTGMFSDTKRAQVLRGIVRLCRREHIPLRHGTIKHARDLIRQLERNVA